MSLNITGVDTEDILKEFGQDGCFLIRHSWSAPGNFILSVMYTSSEVNHIKIQNQGHYYDLYGGEKFANLKELVQYYTENQGQLRTKGGPVIQLRYPVLYASDRSWFHGEKGGRAIQFWYPGSYASQGWFHGSISGKEAERLLQDKNVKNHSFLVRESRSSRTNCVISVKIDLEITHIMIRCKDGKYDVGGGEQFDSMSDLIEHYRKSPMVQTSGTVVHLKQPIKATRSNPSDIRAHLLEMESRACQMSGRGEYSREFDTLLEIDCEIHYVREEGERECNVHKNRYSQILPFDYTRVILEDGRPESLGSDYINASYIKTDNLDDHSALNLKTQYIATQGCLEKTVVDFWRMIWQENCRVIVMLTKEVESGQPMCAKYWPEMSEPKIFNSHIGTMTIKSTCVRPTEEKHVLELEMSLKPKALGRPETRTVYQYQCCMWPTTGVPDDPDPFLNFLQEITDRHDSMQTVGPITVHCSSGTGRTGTFIVLDMIIRKLKVQGLQCDIEIHKLVQMIRRQRSGMVQNVTQYKFVYSAIKQYKTNAVKQKQAKEKEDPEHINVGHSTKGARSGDVITQRPRPPTLPKPRLSQRTMQPLPLKSFPDK